MPETSWSPADESEAAALALSHPCWASSWGSPSSLCSQPAPRVAEKFAPTLSTHLAQQVLRPRVTAPAPDALSFPFLPPHQRPLIPLPGARSPHPRLAAAKPCTCFLQLEVASWALLGLLAADACGLRAGTFLGSGLGLRDADDETNTAPKEHTGKAMQINNSMLIYT